MRCVHFASDFRSDFDSFYWSRRRAGLLTHVVYAPSQASLELHSAASTLLRIWDARTNQWL